MNINGNLNIELDTEENNNNVNVYIGGIVGRNEFSNSTETYGATVKNVITDMNNNKATINIICKAGICKKWLAV